MKEFKTYEEQIDLLKSRGLIIEDEEKACKCLEEENYYNIINGYKDLFIEKKEDEERFIEGVKFEDIYELYNFDRVLRNILLKPLLQVENILRSTIAYTFSKKYGNDNYLRYSNFDTLEKNYTSNENTIINRAIEIQGLISSIQSDIAKAIKKKPYVNHYIIKYGFVPMWVLVNCLSLGRLSQFYRLMKQSERIEVSKHWGIEERELKQYIKILAHYRNLCAHDERIYCSKVQNASIGDLPHHNILKIPKVNDRFMYGKDDLLALIIVLQILLPADDFRNLCNKINGRIESLSKKVKSINIDRVLKKMGFPANWQEMKKSEQLIIK